MNLSEIFAGNLRGHAYIAARGLTPQAVRNGQHTCETCKQAEMLPAVLNILNNVQVPAKPMRRVK